MPKQIEGEPYVRISVDEAADLHGNEDVVFVDVRRTDEYIEGHVEGALFITVDDVLGRIDELPRDKDLLSYAPLVSEVALLVKWLLQWDMTHQSYTTLKKVHQHGSNVVTQLAKVLTYSSCLY